MRTAIAESANPFVPQSNGQLHFLVAGRSGEGTHRRRLIRVGEREDLRFSSPDRKFREGNVFPSGQWRISAKEKLGAGSPAFHQRCFPGVEPGWFATEAGAWDELQAKRHFTVDSADSAQDLARWQ